MLEKTDSYRTIAAESKAVFRDRASRFIAIALPVSNEEEIKASLEEIRKSYYDANHHCYAWRLGTGLQYRMNDDGEPSGSAGKPIYGQILSTGLSDVLVVVVRYFGGTKLGIPGLINAYKSASREALDAAEVVEKILTKQFLLTFAYPQMNEVMRIIKEENVRILSNNSGVSCVVKIDVRLKVADRVVERFGKVRGVSVELWTGESPY